MAYSNWGAYVYKDGKRRQDKEDVGVFDTDEAHLIPAVRIFANIMKNEKSGEDAFFKHSHHAVLGDGEVRLCGYKSYPSLYCIKDNVVEELKLPEMNWGKNDYELKDQRGEVIFGDKTWTWSFTQHGGNMIDLYLKEPDGSVWTSTCGYEYGAGFDK